MSLSPNRKKEPRAKSSSPIKSKYYPPVKTTTVDKCPVADPKLGIISENDHRVGLCLCKFCECGQHICPNPLSKDFYPSSTFTTKYKSDYKKAAFDVPLRVEHKTYQPNSFKMDLRTTNQEDFQPFSVSPKKNEHHYYLNTLKTSSPVRSNYAHDFVDWGPNNVQIEKRFHPPFRTQEIPFRGQSSYQQSFRTMDPQIIELYKTNIADIEAKNSTISIGPKDKPSFRTTYTDKMQDYSKNSLNRIVKVNPVPQEVISTSPQQFKTTSNTFYQVKSPETKDPHRVRLALNRKIR